MKFINLLLLIITIPASAQVKFGLQAGANMANVSEEFIEPSPVKLSYDPRIGFVAGVVSEIPFSTSVSFRPELNFIQKGYKDEYSATAMGVTIDAEEKLSLNFIELPLNFVYNFNAGNGKFFLGAGPSFAFGISGKYKATLQETGAPTETIKAGVKFDGKKEADVTDDKYHLKGFDYGLNLLAGYELSSGLFFSLNFNPGFANLNPDTDSKMKTTGLALKIGYMFGKPSTP